MDMRDIPHVVADPVVIGGLVEVLAGELGLAGDHVVEPEVEMSVEEPPVERLG